MIQLYIFLLIGVRIMESKVAKCDCVLEVHDARVCIILMTQMFYDSHSLFS